MFRRCWPRLSIVAALPPDRWRSRNGAALQESMVFGQRA
jgi:hypothetical protein